MRFHSTWIAKYASGYLTVRVLLLASLTIFTHLIFAQSDSPKIADVRVIIDVSGSMKQNDPNNLRQPALELLVKLLPDGSKAGVWTFGKYINMLVPHRDVDADWRQLALEKGSEINSTGLYTNIGEALEKAAYDTGHPNDNYRTSVILLTDGVVDIDREPAINREEWRRIVDKVLPTLQSADYTVHTIALSDNADSELLNKLAVTTDGIAAIAKSADDLMKIFLAAFDNAAPAEQVSLEGNNFVVDSSVEEFTALIFTQAGSAPTRLVSPEEKEYSFEEEDPYLRWYRSDKYDLITVEKPIEGEWRVLADLDPDSRVTVVSNLSLVVKPLRNNLPDNDTETLSLLLSENNKTITRRNFLELLDIQYTLVRKDDGKQWQGSLSSKGVPTNGIYTQELNNFQRAGQYALTVHVDGKSFNREFKHTFSVRQPFELRSEKNSRDGKTQFYFSVSYYGDDIERNKTIVAARVLDPEGRNAIRPFTAGQGDSWELSYFPEVEGNYEFAVRVTTENSQGEKLDVALAPVMFAMSNSDNPFSAPASEPVVADLPQPEPKIDLPEPTPEIETGADDPPPSQAISDPVANQEPTSVNAEPAQESSNKWILYAALGAGNLLILVLAYFAYRMIMGNKSDPALEELEQAVDEIEKVDANPAATAAASAPTMADMDTGVNDTIVEMDSGESPDDSGEGSDDEADNNLEEAPAMHQEDDGESADDLGVTDVEFSLDDFSSDDLDDDED